MEQEQEQEQEHLQYKQRIYPVKEGLDSPYSKKVYQRAFNRFLNKINIHDLQVLLDFSPKVIKEMIIDYILFLRDEKKLRRSSIKVHLAAILHFFQINNDDFTLTTRNFKIHLPSDDSVQDDRPYTRDEIGRIITDGCSDLRSKLVFYLLCGSGLRMGALSKMRIGDLKPVPGHNDICRVQVYARTRSKYYSFTTHENAPGHLMITNCIGKGVMNS